MTAEEIEEYKQTILDKIEALRLEAQAAEAARADKHVTMLVTRALKDAGVSGSVIVTPVSADLRSVMDTPGGVE